MQGMADIDSIREQARSLPPADRSRLARLLSEEDRDEIGAGERGLAALTESTGGEDWSEFYPASLREKKGG
jgi:hypothetical protein